MDYCIIKLYLNEKQDNFHDIQVCDNEKTIEEMKIFAFKNGKYLIFESMTNVQYIGLPIENTPYAEIEYTGEINDEEKKYYIESLKKLSTDAALEEDSLAPFSTLEYVRFKKIDDEIYEIE